MRFLFVVNNLNIGGPQKSLLSLLHAIPRNEEIDLLVMNGDTELKPYLPPHVNLIKGDKQVGLLMMSKKNFTVNLLSNLLKKPKLVFKVLLSIFISKVKGESLTQEKQKFWFNNKRIANIKIQSNYDYSIAVSGGHSMMFITDFVKSNNKIGWVRTEYQNLNRDLNIDNYYFDQMDKVLSVSNKCTEKFQEFFPEQVNKVRTFYNPLPFIMYENINIKETNDNYNNNKHIISSISRLDKSKGFELVILTASLLKKKNIDFIWNIYGSGPYRKIILKSIKKYQLEKHVYLKGFVFNTGEVLKNTSVLVHTSKFEGKSNTIDEAKYYKVPIVSTRFPTVDEQLKNEVNGLISDFNEIELAKSIINVLYNEDIREDIIGNLGIERKNYLNRDIFAEFKNILED